MLNNYLRFVVSSKDDNKSRLSTAPYWKKILSHSEKISVIDSVGVEYNYSKFEKYLFNTCGSSILTYLLTHSAKALENELFSRGIKLNQHQQMLVNNYLEDCDFYIIE